MPKRPAEAIPRPASTRRQRASARLRSPRVLVPLLVLVAVAIIVWAVVERDYDSGNLVAVPVALIAGVVAAARSRAP